MPRSTTRSLSVAPQKRHAKEFIAGTVSVALTNGQERRISLASLPMRFVETKLAGAWIVELEPHHDDRGFFARTFCEEEFGARDLPTRFPQSNLSRNDRAGTLRGMHFNTSRAAESKLVRCSRGAVHDVIVDIRPESSTYLQWIGVDLTAEEG